MEFWSSECSPTPRNVASAFLPRDRISLSGSRVAAIHFDPHAPRSPLPFPLEIRDRPSRMSASLPCGLRPRVLRPATACALPDGPDGPDDWRSCP